MTGQSASGLLKKVFGEDAFEQAENRHDNRLNQIKAESVSNFIEKRGLDPKSSKGGNDFDTRGTKRLCFLGVILVIRRYVDLLNEEVKKEGQAKSKKGKINESIQTSLNPRAANNNSWDTLYNACEREITEPYSFSEINTFLQRILPCLLNYIKTQTNFYTGASQAWRDWSLEIGECFILGADIFSPFPAVGYDGMLIFLADLGPCCQNQMQMFKRLFAKPK